MVLLFGETPPTKTIPGIYKNYQMTLSPDIAEVELSDVSVEDIIESRLVVYNDDFNTFQWVIECFCKYLDHTPEQAEQCAMIIHYKGKCQVKNGSKEKLKPLKNVLIECGLSVVIE
jgi:ATP-dependent Clp protease adaptor protein ClpS